MRLRKHWVIDLISSERVDTSRDEKYGRQQLRENELTELRLARTLPLPATVDHFGKMAGLYGLENMDVIRVKVKVFYR